MFVWTAPATYEVHIMVMPQGRGATAYRMVREAVAWLADEGAERIWARVDTPRLRHVAAQTGFKRCGELAGYDLYQWKKPCLQH